MIRVSFPAPDGATSTSTYTAHLGYFNNITEAKKALRGLSPSHFGGCGNYTDFHFEDVLADTKHRDKSLERAREQLKWPNSHAWSKPAPLDWGEE